MSVERCSLGTDRATEEELSTFQHPLNTIAAIHVC